MSKAYYRDEDVQTQSSKGIFIQNLIGKLEDMTEADIKRLFSKFGEIVSIEMEMNPVTKKNGGNAIVKYTNPSSASNAIKHMNGYVVNGAPLIVVQLSPYLTMGTRSSIMGVDDKGSKKQPGMTNIIIHEDDAPKYSVSTVDTSDNPRIKTIIKQIKKNQHYIDEPTKIIGLFNLFDFQNKSLVENKAFMDELLDDVYSKLKSRL